MVPAGASGVGTLGRGIGGPGPAGFAFHDNVGPAAHGVKPLQVVDGRHPHGPDEVGKAGVVAAIRKDVP